MLTSEEIRKRLALCLPKLSGHLGDTETLAEAGLDSIDLVDLFCFIQSEFGVDPSNLQIGPHSAGLDLLAAISRQTPMDRGDADALLTEPVLLK
jgi:acyl carrier protein